MLYLSFEQLQSLITQNQKVCEAEQLSLQLYHTTYSSTIDTPICHGSALSTIIREGITLLRVHLCFKQTTRAEIMSLQPQIGFAFCLSGSSVALRSYRDFQPINNASLLIQARTGYIYVTSSSEGWQQFEANVPFEAIYIHFSYAAFKQMLGEQLHELPAEFLNAIHDDKANFIKYTKLSNQILSLCEALFANPFSGKSREFYTEAKVIELIAYQIDELSKPQEEVDSTGPLLTQREEELVEQCHQLLSKNLVNPPSLIELAREIGMSDYRLKNGFKQKYGHTPYRFVTEKRMIKAKELLSTGRMNVSEVASAVGFTSLGSFSNSFYEKFGIRPSEIR